MQVQAPRKPLDAAFRTAILSVAHDGCAHRPAMRAQLMGAPRARTQLEPGNTPGGMIDDPVLCLRILPVIDRHDPLLALCAALRQRNVDHAGLVFGNAGHERPVGLLHIAPLEQLGQA